MGFIAVTYNLHPDHDQKDYGRLITALTTIPCLLSAPFFFLSGLKMRAIKRRQVALGEITKEDMKKDG